LFDNDQTSRNGERLVEIRIIEGFLTSTIILKTNKESSKSYIIINKSKEIQRKFCRWSSTYM